jgi:hypothetical protein
MKLNKVFRKGDGEGCAVLIIFLLFALVVGTIYFFNQRLKQEEHCIEGTIQSAKVINENNNIEVTHVYFADGRFKKFFGVPLKPLETGKYYSITYNGFNSIVKIEEAKP